MKDYIEITKCRLCESDNLKQVLSFKDQPLANNFTKYKVENEKYPLKVNECQECGHCQLSIMVDNKKLYEHYKYKSGNGFKKHFEDYKSEVCHKLKLKNNDLVIDIGSNDGQLLDCFKNHHYSIKTVGVEPAIEIAKEANEKGIYTINRFFDEDAVEEILIKFKGQKAKVVIANNIFAHVPSLIEFVNLVKKILDRDEGLFIIEVQALQTQLDKTIVYNFYHEHIDYHQYVPLRKFFQSLGMDIFDIKDNNSHEGSYRIYIGFKEFNKEKFNNTTVAFVHGGVLGTYYTNKEQQTKGKISWEKFQKDIDLNKDVFEDLKKYFKHGAIIIGFCAAAKSTVLISEYEAADIFDVIIDDNEMKHGYSPHGIKIVGSEYLDNLKDKNIIGVVLANNFYDQIKKKYSDYKNIQFRNVYGF